MREGVIPDRVAFPINALGKPRELIRLNPDQKESCGGVLLLEHVQDLWSPLRIRAVIERNRNFVQTVPVTAYAVRFRQVLENFVGDQLAIGIDRQIRSEERRVGKEGR